MKTRAAVLRTLEAPHPYADSSPLVVEELELDEPHAGELLVRVVAGVSDVVEGDHVVLTFVPSCGHCDRCSSGNPAMCRPAAAANGAGRMPSGGQRFSRADGTPVHQHLGVSAFSERTVVARGSAVVIDEDIPLDTAVLAGCGV